MELEELDHAKPYAQLRDLETIEGWAERNGIAYGVARAWAMKAVIPTLKVGKRRMVNSALFRSWLLEQDWTA
ncbi:DNA-binding protein [Ectopseudomonas khazarica]|uniref:DNA-binding protein n=1 Tax=Ectopseudomonas khazarica TaxID=2502979 RepID=UPI0037C71F93